MNTVDWTQVLIAVVLTVPAVIAAVYAGRTHRQVRTPSGATIGKQVEDALHTVLANNYHLQTIGDKVEAPASPKANGEASKVEALADPPASEPER